jgi:lipid biosynthesis B12-binding/radical SAM protein
MGEIKVMRVFLISSNIASAPYSVYPLGLSMVAGSLRNAGHEVKQFDFLASNRSITELTGELKKFSPDIIGVSIRNIDNVNFLNEQRYIEVVEDIVKNIRKVSKAKIILGGSGFSIMPEAILDKVGADYGIVGEGESLILEFIEKIKNGSTFKTKILRSSSSLKGKDMPSAFYDDRIMQFYLKSGNIAAVQTKRGCIYKCIYCSYPILEGDKIRIRDAKEVVDDIEVLINKHKAKYIFFTDSVFNDDQGNYLKVLEEMKFRRLNIPWTAFFKPGKIDTRSLLLMKATGLKAAEIGADAPSDITLKGLGKSFLFKDIIKFNNTFAKHDIATAHYFMFGCPGETKETVIEGINNIKSIPKTSSFIFMGIRILPGTLLAQLAIKEGLIKSGQDLLESIYYIAPGLEKKWLEETLTEGFRGIRNCVFPPDSLDSSLAFLHKLGYSGSLLEMFVSGGHKRNQKKHDNK